MVEHEGTPYFAFDSQAHLVRRDITDGRLGIPKIVDAGAVLVAMDAAGIDAALMSPIGTPYDDYRLLNEETLEAQSRYSGRIYACPRLQPLRGQDAVAELEHVLKLGAKAVKLDPFRDSAYAINDLGVVGPLCEAIASANLLMLVDSSEIWLSSPSLVSDLARHFPTLSIVVGHSGGIWEHHDEMLVAAKERPNLFLETSRTWPPAFVGQAVAELGKHRVIFGTDFPPSPPAWELDKVVKYAGLSIDECEHVVGLNLARLLDVPAVQHRHPKESRGGGRP